MIKLSKNYPVSVAEIWNDHLDNGMIYRFSYDFEVIYQDCKLSIQGKIEMECFKNSNDETFVTECMIIDADGTRYNHEDFEMTSLELDNFIIEVFKNNKK